MANSYGKYLVSTVPDPSSEYGLTRIIDNIDPEYFNEPLKEADRRASQSWIPNWQNCEENRHDSIHRLSWPLSNSFNREADRERY